MFRIILMVAPWLALAAIGAYYLFGYRPVLRDIPEDRGAYLPQPTDAMGDKADRIVFLSQNWSPGEAVRFYSSPHGSHLVPYSWYMALEQAGSSAKFNDPEHIRTLRYLPQRKSEFNPDALPIGFVKDGDTDWLGLNCAACHTGQINFRGTGIRVDGGPGMGDLDGLMNGLIDALQATLADAGKFARFAQAVRRTDEAALRADIGKVIQIRKDYNTRNDTGHPVHGSPKHPPYGFARVDAFGAILNQITVLGLGVAENARVADAPVSYPFLWDTPQHDFVQWNAGVPNATLLRGNIKVGALGRNAGEVLGVFGELTVRPRTGPVWAGNPSSVRLNELIWAEDSLARLWSPEWPQDVLGSHDTARAAEGEKLYAKHCARCHKVFDGDQRKNPLRTVTAVKVGISEVGTDAKMTRNFATRRYRTGVLAGSLKGLDLMSQKWAPDNGTNERDNFKESGAELLRNTVMGVIVHGILERPGQTLAEFARSAARDAPADDPKYKARPLNGIWATAPYLHNGSVPSLYQLLKPGAERPKTFYVGRLEFDPKEVGYLYKEEHGNGAFKFDATLPGNLNSGHEYGAVPVTVVDDMGQSTTIEPLQSDEERWQLIEFLKTL